MMTAEGLVKSRIKKALKKYGCYYTMPIGSGYGSNGTPDFVVCCRGNFIGIEAKATSAKKPTALQFKHLKDIKLSGGVGIVIHADNLEYLESLLLELTPPMQE